MEFTEGLDLEVDGEFLRDDFSLFDFIAKNDSLISNPEHIHEEIIRLAEQEKYIDERYKIATLKSKRNLDFSVISATKDAIKSALDLTIASRGQLRDIETTYANQISRIERLNSTRLRLVQLLDVLKLIRHSITVNDSTERSLTLFSTQNSNSVYEEADSIKEAINSINQCRLTFEQLNSTVLKNKLSSRLERFTGHVEERIDNSFMALTLHFDPEVYSSLMTSYNILFLWKHSKHNMFGERLTNIFRMSINDNIQHSIALHNHAQKLHFEAFQAAFCAAFEKTWTIMKSFYDVFLWHQLHFDEAIGCPNLSFEAISITAVQNINMFLQSFTDFDSLDDFIFIVNFVSQFIKMCEQFASFEQSTVHGLEEYISNLHSWANVAFTSLNKLKCEEVTFQLDNEQWHDCPVACFQASKRVVLIHELQILVRFVSDLPGSNSSQEETQYQFEDPLEISFLTSKEHTKCAEPIEGTGVYHISSTGVNFLRLFGKYISVMDIFPSTSFLVISSVYQMLFVSIKIVFCTFMNHTILFSDEINVRIHTFRITLGIEQACANSDFTSNADKVKAYLVAMETIKCISSHLYMSHTLLFKTQVDETYKIIQLFDLATDLTKELNEFVCRFFGRTLICKQLISSIVSINWNCASEIQIENPPYVQSIVNNVRYMKELVVRLTDELSIKDAIYSSIWDEFSMNLCHTLIDGYGHVKKCSNEGRGQMLIDFHNLMASVHEILEFDCFEKYKDAVLNLIKAFYMDRNDIEVFIRSNKVDYSNKQLSCLISSMDHLGFMAKQKLQIIINNETNH